MPELSSSPMSDWKTAFAAPMTPGTLRKLTVKGRLSLAILGPHRAEGFDVGPAEAEDRLFGVPDEEQSALLDRHFHPALGLLTRHSLVVVGSGEQVHDLDLQRVGVLELVHHDDRPGVVQALTHRRAVAQQVPCEHEQVMEVQGALGAATLGLEKHPVLDPGGQGLGHRRTDVAKELEPCVLCDRQRRHDVGFAETGLGPRRRLTALGNELRRKQLEHVHRVVGPVEGISRRGGATLEACGQVVVGWPLATVLQRHIKGRNHLMTVDAGEWAHLQGVVDQPVPGPRHGASDVVQRGQDARVDGQAGKQLRPHALILEDLVEKAAPRIVRADRAGHRVGDPEARRQPGLDRRFAEDASRETMQGHDECVLQRREGIPAPAALHLVIRLVEMCAPAGTLQALPDATAQLGRGVLGEGDRGQLADLCEVTCGHHVDDASDE